MKTITFLRLVDGLCLIQVCLVSVFVFKNGFQKIDLWIVALSLTFAFLCASYFRTMLQLMSTKEDARKMDDELKDLFRKADTDKKASKI
ncbi:MAG TPA: hypothetical protein P5160_07980 [Candidatus Omnitrophota bacterium]|nr:hypothetical protein [Candidatus Omnitrophota bacterium]